MNSPYGLPAKSALCGEGLARAGSVVRVLNFLFDDRYGGPQKRVIDVSLGLRERGVETIICLPDRGGNARRIATDSGLNAQTVKAARVPSLSDPKSLLRWLWSLPADVGRFIGVLRRQRPDVAHVNGAFFVAPALAAKLARVPLVWHLNDTIMPPMLARIFGLVVRALSTRLVVAAEAVARHYGVACAPHTVLYPPVDIAQFRESSIHRTLERKPMRRVGTIANWNPVKGLEYFVEAAALVRERYGEGVEFAMAGSRLGNQADYAATVDHVIDDKHLREVILEYGFIDDVAEVLKELDILVLSSTSEASPMVVLESMAAGVPVVATDVGGVRELIRDPGGAAGIVVPRREPRALADGVSTLLDDAQMANSMGHRGRKLARKKFSIEACVGNHYRLYRSVSRKQLDTDL